MDKRGVLFIQIEFQTHNEFHRKKPFSKKNQYLLGSCTNKINISNRIIIVIRDNKTNGKGNISNLKLQFQK